jgi:hypothetical protein
MTGTIKKILREGSVFVMTVELQSGDHEEWTYVREETSNGLSYSMIGREDA